MVPPPVDLSPKLRLFIPVFQGLKNKRTIIESPLPRRIPDLFFNNYLEFSSFVHSFLSAENFNISVTELGVGVPPKFSKT